MHKCVVITCKLSNQRLIRYQVSAYVRVRHAMVIRSDGSGTRCEPCGATDRGRQAKSARKNSRCVPDFGGISAILEGSATAEGRVFAAAMP